MRPVPVSTLKSEELLVRLSSWRGWREGVYAGTGSRNLTRFNILQLNEMKQVQKDNTHSEQGRRYS